jgi:hypothetical protein
MRWKIVEMQKYFAKVGDLNKYVISCRQIILLVRLAALQAPASSAATPAALRLACSSCSSVATTVSKSGRAYTMAMIP